MTRETQAPALSLVLNQARPSGEIIRLPVPAPRPHALTAADRIEALAWASANAETLGGRLAFYRWSDTTAAEAGDYISIYRANDRWAAWGAARRGRSVRVWRCATGTDLGHFPTMREALAAVPSVTTTRGLNR